jgi:hypothetical protein
MGTADGTVVGTTKIADHGPPVDRFNVVVVSEGYRKDELSRFHSDAKKFVDHMFNTPPFDELKCAINVYRVDVISSDSGADDPSGCPGGSGATAATYFDATYCGDGVIRRLLVVDNNIVLNVVNVEVPQWHFILVIVNSSIHGGSGGQVATTSTTSGWEDTAIHEMGHAAFGLADEYEYWSGCGIDTTRDNYTGSEPSQPNVTIDTNRATIKWGNLIASTAPLPTTSNSDCTQCDPQPNPVTSWTVGAFEGGHHFHCGAYRPQFDCMMRKSSKPFCAVCQQRIHQTLLPFLPVDATIWSCMQWDFERRLMCLESRDLTIMECTEWTDQGYDACTHWVDQGYATCTDWLPWPLDYLCGAFRWVSNWVCKGWRWVSNWVCVRWRWLWYYFCVAWRWAILAVCRFWHRKFLSCQGE